MIASDAQVAAGPLVQSRSIAGGTVTVARL
jgi:hypothetical protein